VTRGVAFDRDVSKQGHYAGAVTRLVAASIDLGLIIFTFSLATAVVSWVMQLVFGIQVSTDGSIWFIPMILNWGFLYLTVPTSLSGKTLGKALLGLQVVAQDGGDASFVQCAVRSLVLPISTLFFGLGLVIMVVQRDRQTLHDMVAKTVVVYSWDARAAEMRLLAHQPPTRRVVQLGEPDSPA
jgi:uncharacterized RDD family membrane protein YckC